jgi:thioredoxin-like negative regulator of GroEL
MRSFVLPLLLLVAAHTSHAAEMTHGLHPSSAAFEPHALTSPMANVADVSGRYLHHYLVPQKPYAPAPNWVVVFYTRWCTVCDEMGQPLSAVATALRSERLKFMKVDVTDDEGSALRLGVEGFPAVIMIKGGTTDIGSRFEGEHTEAALRTWVISSQ